MGPGKCRGEIKNHLVKFPNYYKRVLKRRNFPKIIWELKYIYANFFILKQNSSFYTTTYPKSVGTICGL